MAKLQQKISLQKKLHSVTISPEPKLRNDEIQEIKVAYQQEVSQLKQEIIELKNRIKGMGMKIFDLNRTRKA